MGDIFGTGTIYGYKKDPYGDSLTRAGWNAIGGQLTPGRSIALSPDLERRARTQGVKIGDTVRIIFSDGTATERVFDDRTMQDEQAIKKFGKPLTGRVDFHTPGGADSPEGRALNGKPVKDIVPAGKGDGVTLPPLPDEQDYLKPLATGKPGDTSVGFPGTGMDKKRDVGYTTPRQDPTNPLSKPEGLTDWGALRPAFGPPVESSEPGEAEKRQAEAAAQADHLKIIAAGTAPRGRNPRWKDQLDAALRMMPG
jgi:hypothetical protein